MKMKKNFNKSISDYMLEHSKFKIVAEWIIQILLTVISSFIFAFGFRSFIAPPNATKLASGGVSGISQILVRIIELIKGHQLDAKLSSNIISVAYFVINIPIFILAWKGIGKRFAILTLLNIAFVSLFNSFIPESLIEVFKLDPSDFISRALFAGICTGLSCSLAFYIGASGGGFDVVSYFFAIKKSSGVGKYIFTFNGIIITVFTILSYVQDHNSAIVLLYTLVYCLSSALVTDNLVKRNKKAQIQIFSNKEDLPQILISAFPHGCTIVEAKGAFSGEGVKMFIMDVSFNEVNKVVELVRAIDDKSFVNVLPLIQIYGKFFISPTK